MFLFFKKIYRQAIPKSGYKNTNSSLKNNTLQWVSKINLNTF